MTSVAILTDNESGKDEVEVKRHLVEELRKTGIDVIETSSFDSLKECKCVILFYNTDLGVTTGFEENLRKLVELNIKPIVLIINAQRPNVKFVKIDDTVSKICGDINQSLYCTHIIYYFYDNDKKVAYQVNTGEETGVDELIETIKIIKEQLKFIEM